MKRLSKETHDTTRGLTEQAQRACLVAKDAAFNVKDYIANSSNIAFVAVKQCEKELDEIERAIDESLPAAITEVTETEARQLLACLKFITDLERIGDLMWSIAQRIHELSAKLPQEDARHLLNMAEVLQKMLEQVHEGFKRHNVDLAESVLRADSEIDHACHSVFRRYMGNSSHGRRVDSIKMLLIAQAFERAGDHTKNLAEEVVHLVRGHSLRHTSRSRLERD